MKTNPNERELHEFGALCAKLGGIFGSDLHRILESINGSFEAKRLIGLALGQEKNEVFLKKVDPDDMSFVGLCFSDIYAPLCEVFFS